MQFRTKDRQVQWAEGRAAEGQDCMPVTAAILSEQAISVRAVCMAPSTGSELSPVALVRLVHVKTGFRHALFAGHAKRLPALFARLSGKNAFGLNQQIADWLLSHACGNEVRATHSEIATDFLTVREVASRKLKQFGQRAGLRKNAEAL